MRNGLVALVVGGALLIAACGGGGTTGSTTAPATEAPAAESSAPLDGGAGTSVEPGAEASTATPASQAPAGGGTGAAASVCELVTAEELAGIFGVASVKMTVLPGPPNNCIVESDGDPLTAWSLTTAQASAVYDAFTVDPSTVQVTGVGDKAAIVQNTGFLVLKGGALIVVMISGGADMSEDEAIEASKQIGVLAAGRL